MIHPKKTEKEVIVKNAEKKSNVLVRIENIK
jgi:hypothetical protein